MDPDRQKTFVNHLEELRRRLLVALAAVLLSTSAAFFYSDNLLRFLSEPIIKVIPQVYFFSPTDAFVIKIKVSLLFGFFIASPVVFGELWGFVAPALYPHEKRSMLPLVVITSLFFIGGVSFAFYEVIPAALGFFLGQETEFLKPMVSMTEYISFLSGMLLAFGVAFNLPVAVVGVVAAGLVRVKTLNAVQKHVIVAIFIASAILTPTPDIASQLLLAVPLLGLFELSVAAAWIVEKMKTSKSKASLS